MTPCGYLDPNACPPTWLAEVKAARGMVVLKPTPDVAFAGRRIAFFMHRAHGLVELVEAEKREQ